MSWVKKEGILLRQQFLPKPTGEGHPRHPLAFTSGAATVVRGT
jgi:hypothetical protein